MTLADLQALFQARLLGGDPAILAHLKEDGRFMAVYDHAYGARLVEALGTDFPALARVLGEDFSAMAGDYVGAHPSRHRSIRWIGAGLAEWLAGCGRSDLADLAAFEIALGLAFDAAEAAVLTADDLGRMAPEAWPGLVFDPHPALSLVGLTWDVLPVWRAASEGAEPVPLRVLAEPRTVATWRDPESATVRYRPLEADEAAAARAMRDGAAFAALCEELAEHVGPDTAAWRAAALIHTWLAEGWLSDLTVDSGSVG